MVCGMGKSEWSKQWLWFLRAKHGHHRRPVSTSLVIHIHTVFSMYYYFWKIHVGLYFFCVGSIFSLLVSSVDDKYFIDGCDLESYLIHKCLHYKFSILRLILMPENKKNQQETFCNSIFAFFRVIFYFKSSKKSNNGTDVNAGQIPQLLYRVMAHEGSVAPKPLHDAAEPVPILSKSFYITVRNVSKLGSCFHDLVTQHINGALM